jgi:hypothetical protein
MQLPDGREVLLRFADDIPVPLMTQLAGATVRAAERLGYTNVVILTGGPQAGWIAATPPARPQLVEPGAGRVTR